MPKLFPSKTKFSTCGKTPRDPPKCAKRKEIEGQAILISKLPTMDTQKKCKKHEINTKTQKTGEQRQSQKREKKTREIKNSQQITKERKKEKKTREIKNSQ